MLNAITPARRPRSIRVEVVVADRGDREQHDHRERQRVHDAIRKDVVLEIDDGEGDERGREDEIRGKCPRVFEPCGERAEQRTTSDGDHHLTGGRRGGNTLGFFHRTGGGLADGHSRGQRFEQPADREPNDRERGNEGRGHGAASSAAACIASRGASTPVHISNASAAWCTSMPRPFAQGTPRARAAANSGVSIG